MMDGTPIFLLVEESALLHDPSEEELLLFQNVGLIFELGMEGEELRFVSAFRETKKDSKPKIINTLEIDLVSVFKKVVANLKGERIEENRYIFSGETELDST